MGRGLWFSCGCRRGKLPDPITMSSSHDRDNAAGQTPPATPAADAAPPAPAATLEFAINYKIDTPTRLDQFLVAQVGADLSRSLAQKAIEDGKVLVNGKPSKASYKVRTGDHILVQLPEPPRALPTPED